ncbi:GH92 family glycosyl hydrolase [soil metagenome]
MKNFFFSVLFFAVVFFSACGNDKSSHVVFSWNVDTAKFDFAKYVDPMIGTAGHGHTFPGATAPFGMVQLSPDTRVDGSWDGCSGYHYDDDTIYGFSHTHLSGTGCSDYGDILFMPEKGKMIFDNGFHSKEGYRSHFSHANEHSEAGYYSVLLDNSKTKVELTASPRVGVHRYTFPDEKGNCILLDLSHRDEVLDSKIEIVNDHAIQGYRFSKAWANNQKEYFYAEFSSSIILHEFNNDTIKSDSLSGRNVKCIFTFEKSKSIIVKVALSAVSCENAKLNMETEVPDFDFDAVRKKVKQQWNSELGKIEVQSGDETKKKIFYTALYHCFIAPNIYCDVNGDYRGMDNKIHTDTIHPQYTVFSLWDTYRALHPLFTIIQPKRDQDFINTFVKQYQEGGTLPVWELSANETNCMIGYHSVPVIVDAWMKGLTDFDTTKAYEAMVHSAMQNTNGLDAYKKYGFIPAEGESESVSKTLEYAYDDWCIALAAKRMKKEDDYKYFLRRSQSWRNLYDPETGFFRPRMNNSFVQPFDPNEVNFHYTEANAWQYSLAVQQDIPGLIAAHGGDKKFVEFLDKLFAASSQTSGRDQADISGLIGQYAQGNEPSHHMAYLYDFTSEPWKTQEIVSKICNEMYTDKPDGLCGNEDCGQMSAWYVMSMLGIYDVTPGTENLHFGSPGFAKVILHLENGNQFEFASGLPVTASDVYPGYAYRILKSVELNNKKLSKGYFSINEIRKGGKIFFNMEGGMEEAGKFETTDSQKESDNQYYPLVPLVRFAHDTRITDSKVSRTFTDKMIISLDYHDGLKYFTSINGRPFVEQTVLFQIDSSSVIRSFSKNEKGICSDTVEFHYLKIPGGRSIKLNTQYANQYSAGGNEALIDGIYGGENFRTGEWQGYEGKDIDAVVDLGSVKDVSLIGLSCLQDQNSWIFMPSYVSFYASTDGKNFKEIETKSSLVERTFLAVSVNEFRTQKPVKARYIKVFAKNGGPCPDWHVGRGNPSWIFADEITIKTN